MRRVMFRSLWEHKRRLVSTVVAVLLGVAFLTGTFVFSDTLNRSLDELFAEGWEDVDVRVQGEVIFESDFGDLLAPLDQGVVDLVRQVDGVAEADPYVFVEGFGPNNRVLDDDGDPIGVDQGPPTIFESWLPNNLFDYRLTDGSRPPEADDEVVLDVGAADDGDFEVGDRITLATQFGPAEYTLVGTFTFGERESLGGIVVAAFTLTEAQRLAGSEGKVNNVVATAVDGVSSEELARRVEQVVPPESRVLTGEEAAAEDADAVQQGLAFLNQVLSIFGTIALVVATFLIANTFQILVAQRTRELALLRAVGASRGQVLASVLAEAVLIGVIAAVLGILAGIALAVGITALLDGLGIDLPTTTLVISPGTIAFGLAIGVVVTVVSSVGPALRATRVPPLAAIRDVAVERAGASRLRTALAAVALVASAFALSRAWTSDSADELGVVGIGALLLVTGIVMLGPAVAGPVVRFLGSPLPRLRGVTGRLAVENAARAPKRTAATAAALLIAVALVGFVTIFAESAKRSVAAEVDRGLTADLIVQPDTGAFGGFGGFSPEVARAVSEVEGVELVAAASFEPARLTFPDGDTSDTFLGAVDPDRYAVLADPRMERGSLTDLRHGGILVDRQAADDRDLEVGDAVGVTFTNGGSLQLEVQGISDDPMMLGMWTVHRDDLGAQVSQLLDIQVFLDVADDADLAAVQQQVSEVIDPFPAVEVVDRDEFVGDLADQLSAFVNVIYGLLALSILIAMIGVANTLALSVYERTRELGLLRAVGMARSQMRSAIRWEAVLIALLGTVAGLVLGLVASYALVEALGSMGLSRFAVPVPTLVVQVVIAAGLAVLASVRTARRAARLDILDAIATE